MIVVVSLVWNLSNPGTISYRHGVNLSFDLLVPRQGSLQTLLGVQLRVSALIDVAEKYSIISAKKTVIKL